MITAPQRLIIQDSPAVRTEEEAPWMSSGVYNQVRSLLIQPSLDSTGMFDIYLSSINVLVDKIDTTSIFLLSTYLDPAVTQFSLRLKIGGNS